VFSQNNFASHRDVLTGSGSDSWSGDFTYETENIKDMMITIQVDENATKYNVRSLRQRVGNTEKTLQNMTEKMIVSYTKCNKWQDRMGLMWLKKNKKRRKNNSSVII